MVCIVVTPVDFRGDWQIQMCCACARLCMVLAVIGIAQNSQKDVLSL